MRYSPRWSSRLVALTAAALGSAAMLILARPTRGQQGPFSIQASVPGTASNAPTTEVSYSFPLPRGFQLRWNPRVRVTGPTGRLEELLPMYINQQSPVWTGHRGLHTESYAPGVYFVSVEADYVLPGGSTGTVSTPATLLTVPSR